MKDKLKIILNCFISLLIIILLIILFISFMSDNQGLKKIGGYSLLSVEGDSMYPKIKNGDLIAIDRKKKNLYEIGDIVSFADVNGNHYDIITHEIVYVEKVGNEYRYHTKGINNVNNDNDFITNEEIIGEYKDFRIPLIGYVVSFANTKWGYLLLVVLPLGIVLIVSICELSKEVNKKKEEF